MRLWILGLLMLSISASASYLDKSQMEANLQTKAQHILDTMFGDHLFSVSASLSFGKESWLVNYTEQASVQFNKPANTPRDSYNILPGYQALKNLSPNEAVQLPFNSQITKVPAPLIKIVLNIVASNTVSKQDVKNADRLLTTILNLDAERGDKIEFIFEEFPLIRQSQEVKVGLPIEAKLMIMVLIVTSFFIIVYILLKIKELNIDQEVLKAQKASAKAAVDANRVSSKGPDLGSDSDDAQSVAIDGMSSDTSRFFDFVGPHNHDQFLSVLLKRALPVDQLAMVVSYLPSRLAKQLMDSLTPDKKQQVIMGLCDEKLADKQTLVAIESALKTDLECSMGGAAVVAPLIRAFDDDEKSVFLNQIQSSHVDLYRQIRPSILLFSDIEKLEDAEVKKLIGALKLEVLATSIVNDASASAEKITANLSGAAKAMVTQFIELKKESMVQSDIRHAKTVVVDLLKQLSDRGVIKIAEKITR